MNTLNKVVIVADSGCDLPKAWTGALGVPVVPVYTTFEGVALRDGVDITPEGALAKIRAGLMPTLSQPSPADFLEVYRSVAATSADEAGAGKPPPIVSIHVTSKLSGTQNSARLAQGMCPELDITIVDTGTGSLASGFVVLKAARAAQAGAGRDEVVTMARQAAAQSAFFLLVPDLTFIHRSGRLGKAGEWLGHAVSLAPVLTVRGGVVVPYRLALNRQQGLRALVAAAARRYARDKKMLAAAIHVDAAADAAKVLEEARHHFEIAEGYTIHAGAAVSAVLGPGTVGLCLTEA